MAITMQDIAKRANVSRGTVDRALNDRGRIDPAVKERILAIADEMGYVQKHRRRRRDKRLKIGVVTQLAKYSFMTELNRGLANAAAELEKRGITLLLEEGLSVDEKEQSAAITRLLAEGIDALAIMPVDHDLIRAQLNALSGADGIPFVTFNTDIIGTGRLAYVGMDNEKSGRTAAGLLSVLTRGTGKILVVTGNFGNRVGNMRVDGFVDEVKTAYPEMEIVGVQSCFDDASELEKVVIRSMRGAQTIGGILVVSAGQQGLDRAFAELQMDRRPYVVTYDLTPWSRQALLEERIDFLIDQDAYWQGYRAVNLLASLLLSGEQPEQEFYHTDIIIKSKYNL